MLSQSTQNWLSRALPWPEFQISPLVGDASSRSYYRLQYEDQSRLLMVSPPEKEDSKPFIAIAKAWHAVGLPVPIIFDIEEQSGCLILEDFGDILYSKALSEENADVLYEKALEALLPLSQAPQPISHTYPVFNADMMWREFYYIFDWLLPKHLNLTLSHTEEKQLKQEMAACIENVLKQPQCVVHRDYHSRNLLLRKGNTLGIIDFQDAVIGPLLYDPVSLLKDAYIDWPEEKIWEWVETFRSNGYPSVSSDTFRWWFDMVSIQRHCKVLGIFARLAYRDNKRSYLKDMPRVAGYLLQTLSRYPEWSALNQLIKQRIAPHLECTL